MNDEKGELVLLGDSTLDNVVWVKQTSHAIPSKLRLLLGDKFNVYNLAADGFRSDQVLNGGYPFISYNARERCNDPFPGIKGIDEVFKPLDELKKLKPSKTVVILSVGGNDVREILGKLTLDVLEKKLKKLKGHYQKILEEIRGKYVNDEDGKNVKIVIMTQYKPSVYADNHYRVYDAMGRLLEFMNLALDGSVNHALSLLEVIMEKVYTFIFDLAIAYKAPIVDLSNSFDCFNENLYTHQIEPSNEGGDIIAKIISHVLSHHNFESNSKIYTTNDDGEVKDRDNNGEWSVGPTNELKNLLKGFLSL